MLGEERRRTARTRVKTVRSSSTRPPQPSATVARAPARCKRLVQPPAHRRIHRNGRDLRDRELHVGAVRGPGQRGRLGRRLLHGQRRQRRRRRLFPFKYDATAPSDLRGHRDAREPERAGHVAEVERHAGRRGLQSARPERTGRVVDLPRDGERRQGHRPRRRPQVRVPGDRRRRGCEPRRAEASSLVATGALLSPTAGLQITMKSPPTLAWASRSRRATYYNVQLIRARAQGAERLARAVQLPTAANVAVQGTSLSTAARAFTAGTSGPDTGGSPPLATRAPARKQHVRRDEVGPQRAPARRRSPLRGRRAPAHAGRCRAVRTSLATRLRRSSRR